MYGEKIEIQIRCENKKKKFSDLFRKKTDATSSIKAFYNSSS